MSSTAEALGASQHDSKDDKREKVRLPLLDALMREQQDLSAVERFSQLHEEDEFPVQQKFYKDLIPTGKPGSGQQYAFQVDLDACSGCKACVTACHNLNGLAGGETWRSVGLLHGGTEGEPVQKTVTTACHHCVDPACMQGCPVKAYEKDPETGIVRHLDDQCIGCQYCIFTCPYEVPQFNAERGIVRKCDMCQDRLADGEAPACVQACPNEAISIRIVDEHQVLEDAQGDAFLPGVPSPGITAPTTQYNTSERFPRNMLPADFYAVRPAHQHVPLVWMLVLTQLSAGAFWLDQLLPAVVGERLLDTFRPLHGFVALSLGLLALAASTAHLGRPLYAFRAVLGLRTSWLSREILAFGLFAGLSASYAGALVLGEYPQLAAQLPRAMLPGAALTEWLGAAVAATGALGVFASVMVYAVTQRLWWTTGRVLFRFFGTALLLGLAVTTCTSFVGAARVGMPLDGELLVLTRLLAFGTGLATLIKLGGEASVLLHLRDKQQGDLKRSALLLTGELQRMTELRGLLAFLGGLVMPALLLTLRSDQMSGALFISITSLLLLLAGEVLERMNFFSALSSPRMPGGLS